MHSEANTLSTEHRRNGFLSGFPVFPLETALYPRQEVENLEDNQSVGAGNYDPSQFFRVNGHVVLPLPAGIAPAPKILDIVETILGLDPLVWWVELFTEEPTSPHVVSWHQDVTHRGMGRTDDEGETVHGPLRPREVSLHRWHYSHASDANARDDRRLGVFIRYVTPDDRKHALGRDWAVPLSGEVPAASWDCIAGLRGLFHPADLRPYTRTLDGQAKTLSAGATQKVELCLKGRTL